MAATPFDEQLAKLGDLSDDELVALEDQISAAFEQADSAGDQETMTALADALDQVLAEKEKRGGGGGEAEAAPPEAEAASGAPVPTPTEAPSETKTEGGSQVPALITETTPEVPEDNKPVVASAAGAVVVAGADIPGTPAGSTIATRGELNKAFAARINTLRRLTGGDGEQVIIASIIAPKDEARTLYTHDPEGNAEKIENITSPAAITAAGGCCAPLTTKYDLFGIGDTDRPVKDALAGFNADRGGIRYFIGPTLANAAGAVGTWDCTKEGAVDPANNATWKVCARVNCPTEQTALVQAITMCITYGVQASRVFPELVDTNNKLALVAQARVSESVLLSQVKAGSFATAGPAAVYGASRDILRQIDQVLAYYRDRHRLAPGTKLRAIFPQWFLNALRSDITAGPSYTGSQDHFGLSLAEIEAFFSERDINITWALDSAVPGTNGGGFYATAGASIPAFPNSVEWGLYVEGTWLVLDGGTLDLGIVRDSSLVRQNDYMMFTETWESAVRIGGESLWVTTPLKFEGRYAPPLVAS